MACVAVKCDHVLCPEQFLFLQKMRDFKEQCICINLFQIGKIGAENFQMLTFAFREEAVRKTVVFVLQRPEMERHLSRMLNTQGACLPQNVQKCGTYLRDLS